MNTKEKLATALKDLMNHKDLAQITISDITNHAHLNRQTFYYHFHDIYDLLNWIFQTELGNQNKKDSSNWEDRLLKSFTYFTQHQKFYNNCFHSLGREQLELFLYHQIFSAMYEMIEKATYHQDLSAKEKETIANFYTYATIGLFMKWLRDGMKEEPKEIIKQMKLLFQFNPKEVIHNYRNENA